MQTLTRTFRPDSITRNGREYFPIDGEVNDLIPCLRVEVLARNLRGREDLHGKPYTPSVHYYQPKPLYKLIRMFKVSNRREVVQSGITDRELAKSLTNSYKSTSRSFVGFQSY